MLDFPECVFWDGIFTAISQKNTLTAFSGLRGVFKLVHTVSHQSISFMYSLFLN